MKETMDYLRKNRPSEIAGLKVLSFADYKESKFHDLVSDKTDEINLPKSDVLEFRLEKGASVILRPSGTEPKMKAYYTATADTKEQAEAIEASLAEAFPGIIGF